MRNVTQWLLGELMKDTQGFRSTIIEYAPGDTVFRIGDDGSYLAVLLAGSVEIRKGSQIISIVEPGAMFGEMGIIDRQPRIADAIAATHCRIAQISEGQFVSLLESTPHFALAVMRLLTNRLRRQIET